MKKVLYIVFLFCGVWAKAQVALYNAGNLQIHQDGQLGLHIALINNGIIDENLGLAGFYGDLPLSVSGAFAPTFFELEIANPNHVLLNTGINALNTANFILGNFQTPRTATDSYLNFILDATVTDSGAISKVDGYAAITNKQSFTFPVGDGQHLRPLVLNSNGLNNFVKCAYFFESPDSPSTFATRFNTTVKTDVVDNVSTLEFWRLEGSVPSTVQLSWNERSSIAQLTNDPSALAVVGWSKTAQQWESLAGGPATGTISQGFASSLTFVPNDYEVLTLASALDEPQQLFSADNYLITPNGDGTNDVLIIPDLEASPNNNVQIFDRFGIKVFEMANYTNEFGGFSNKGGILAGKDKGLPNGIYFFVVEMSDLNVDLQGFLYLLR